MLNRCCSSPNSIPTELIPRVPLEQLPVRVKVRNWFSVLFALRQTAPSTWCNERVQHLPRFSFGRGDSVCPKASRFARHRTAGKMENHQVLINTRSSPNPKYAENPTPPEKTRHRSSRLRARRLIRPFVLRKSKRLSRSQRTVSGG